MIKVKEYRHVCPAIPSTWDILADTGDEYHVKYRYGRLKIFNMANGKLGEIIFNRDIDEWFDDLMTFEEMAEHLKDWFDFTNAVKIGHNWAIMDGDFVS